MKVGSFLSLSFMVSLVMFSSDNAAGRTNNRISTGRINF